MCVYQFDNGSLQFQAESKEEENVRTFLGGSRFSLPAHAHILRHNKKIAHELFFSIF